MPNGDHWPRRFLGRSLSELWWLLRRHHMACDDWLPRLTSKREYLAEFAFHGRRCALDVGVIHRDHFDVADFRAALWRRDIAARRIDAVLRPKLLRLQAQGKFGE